MNPFVPTIPTSPSANSQTVEERSSIWIPASVQIAEISSPRPEWRSWLPRTAQTGIVRSRQAPARTTACSGSPCVVRSPASRIRSASLSTRAKASSMRKRVASEAWTSPAAAILTMLGCSTVAADGKPRRDAGSVRRRVQAATGNDEEGRPRLARCGHPARARGRARLVGARRPAERARRRLPRQAGGRRTRSAGTGRGRLPHRAAAGAVAAEGLRRRHPRRPDLPAARWRGRRRAPGALRGARGGGDAAPGRQARGPPRAEAPRADGAESGLLERPGDRAGASGADRLGRGAAAHGPLAVRAGVLHAAPRAGHRSEVELRPGSPPVVGPRHERVRVDLLDVLPVPVLDEPRGGVELDLDLARAPRVVRLHCGEILERLLRARLDQLTGLQRRILARAELPEPLLDGDCRQSASEQLLRLAADGLVPGDEQNGTPPLPAQRGVDPRLPDRRAVEFQLAPRLTGDRVRHHAVGRPRLRVHGHEQRRVAPLLEELGVLGPVVLDDVLAVRVELVRDQRVERPLLARAVAVHNDDLLGAGCLRAADGRIDLFGVELAPLVVGLLFLHAIRLLPLDDPGDAFHVADDEDLHRGRIPQMETGLVGKRVLVTGASGGIGSACARAFAAEGAEVVVHYHRGRERAEALAAELGRAVVIGADLTREDEVGRLFAEAGRLDVCAAVAGIWPSEDLPVWELPLERWRATLDANLTTTFLTARGFLRQLEGDGALVLVGSTAGIFGEAGHADYAAAKSAILGGLLLSLKNEVVRKNPVARVNAVAPGWTESPMTRGHVSEEQVHRISRTMALRKVAQPEDVANQVVVLASPVLSGHVTGQVVTVAGGMEGRVIHD